MGEKQKGRERGNASESASFVWEPFHHSLCCETVPLLGLSDANCSKESILLSAVYWLPLREDIKWAILHNAIFISAGDIFFKLL